jgi:thymidylate synthase
MYPRIVRWIANEGDAITVRDMETREVRGVTLIVPDVTQPVLPLGIGRKVNQRFAALDVLGIISGTFPGNLLDVAAPGWRAVLVDPDHAQDAAYGPRTAGQWDRIYHILRENPTSRRAVAVIWRPVDLGTTSDQPCTLTLQFLLRDGRLELHSSMRSQDVFLGLAYDLFAFTQVQLTMANWLRAAPGPLIHHVGSLHIYERDFAAAEQLQYRPKPLDIELPRGIIIPEDLRGSTAPQVALNLLDVTPSLPIERANPWYAERVRTTRLARVT